MSRVYYLRCGATVGRAFRKYTNGKIDARGVLARDDAAQRDDLVSRRPKLAGLIDRRVNTKYE